MKNKSFTSLDVWKEGHCLIILIYKLTNNFPHNEKFGLTAQFRRAAVSVTSNIAEGYNRYFFKEKARFYYISRGSLAELQNLLLIAQDIKFISNKEFNKLFNQTTKVIKILNGLINKTKSL